MSKKIRFGKYSIGSDQPVFIIAEIGINHNGSLKTAKKLIDKAIEAGANCAKFQMRDMNSLYINGGDPTGQNLSTQYTLDLLNRFELKPKELFKAFDYCKKKGIMPLCSPWDVQSLVQLDAYSLQGYKVSSADLTNHDLLKAVAKTGKPIIVSTGMSSEDEIIEAVALLNKLKAKYILLNCNSTYPAAFRDVNLEYMKRLAEIGNCPIGYSGHERGFNIAIAAVALGARVIEKHITLDTNMEGSDHRASLLPDEFKQMVVGIRQVEEALGSSKQRKITQGERINRINLAKSLVIKNELLVGEKITKDMIEAKSPGNGIQPNRKKELIGKVAKRNFKAGDLFLESDLDDTQSQSGTYKFNRPWGIPVRYHDFKKLIQNSNPDFLEFHLSYKDLDEDVDSIFDTKYDMGLVVHSPDIFAGDHLLDLSSKDEKYRLRSISELQRVIDTTFEMKKYFKNAAKPLVVASLGGFSKEQFYTKQERQEMYARIGDSLSKIDNKGIEIVAQTLPPFPWYFGGQYFLNLFVDPVDTAQFCSKYNLRLCFDTSHSKLACNHFGWSFSEFVDNIGPHIAHLHIVDASGVDQEGLQIGEGDIDFSALAKQLNKVAPEASFIPEIWMGHENNGEGMWIGLDRLRNIF